MFVRVPEIAQFEWHPFTISSAPERKDAFTLHIRGVGNWTNRLYNYFEEVKAKMGRQSRSASVMTLVNILFLFYSSDIEYFKYLHTISLSYFI